MSVPLDKYSLWKRIPQGTEQIPIIPPQTTEQDQSTEQIFAKEGSFRVTDPLGGQGSASFILITGASVPLPFEVGEQVDVRIGEDPGTTPIWCGTVSRIVESDLTEGAKTTRSLSYSLNGFREIVRRRVVIESYTGQTGGFIVNDLLTKYLVPEGITAGVIESGVVVNKANFNYKKCDQALDQVASLMGFTWWIDAEKKLNFRNRESVAAPYSFDSENRQYHKLKITLSKSKYRNVQYFRAGNQLGTERSDTFAGDGSRKTFTLAYPVGEVPTVEVNAILQTVGIRGVDEGKQWYWQKESREITQDDADSPVGIGVSIKVTYRGLLPIIVKADDDAEIAARAAIEGSTGLYEEVAQDRTIESEEMAFERATALLGMWGKIDTKITFSAYLHGFRAGQLVSLTLPDHLLQGSYLIDQVTIRDRGDYGIVYDITAVGNRPDGGWIGFFRRLVEQGKEFVIAENEVVVLLQTPTDQVQLIDPVEVIQTESGEFFVGTAQVGFSDVAA